MSQLKVVALISGGKDSLFSILHCIANGHDVVALANLYPALRPGESAVDDLESYMYQTIGHAVIPLYQQALGLPLYRQQIVGSAVNQDKSYGFSDERATEEHDETESLVPLLKKVKAAHPEIDAVSTGAILSDYQRTRVDSIAVRLGLVPLSYLWQWPSLPPHSQSSLLEDMAAVGQDSRIIKVASGGLDDTFLWQNVADPRTVARLAKSAERFGSSDQGAILGEGGEYETLAVSGPSPLWKGEIVVEEQHRSVVLGDAGAASLRLMQPQAVMTANFDVPSKTPRIPILLDQQFQKILDTLKQRRPLAEGGTHGLVSDQIPALDPRIDSRELPHGSRPKVFLPSVIGEGENAAEQTRSIMEDISRQLASFEHRMSDIVYTSIIVRDMADFATINAVYGRYFDKPNPPARATVACADVLPKGCYLMIAISSFRSLRHGLRKALHVQSRSYWAPANIGPYSQAVSMPTAPEIDNDEAGFVYVAGQIPLIPASMDLISSEADTLGCQRSELETVLALQHMARIGTALRISRWASVIAFTTVEGPAQRSVKLAMIRLAWEVLHEDLAKEDADEMYDESFDVWYTSNARGPPKVVEMSSQRTTTDGKVPPLYIVEVDALPRGCSVEWAPYGIIGSSDKSSPSGLVHLQHLLHTFRNRII